MTFDDLTARIKDSLHAGLVYAEPYEKDGLTVIPASLVIGGGGGGQGRRGDGDGEGGGFGVLARPAGAFILESGKVRWEPAVDVTRVIATVAFAVVLIGSRFLRHRRKMRRL